MFVIRFWWWQLERPNRTSWALVWGEQCLLMPSSGHTCRDIGRKNQRARAAWPAWTNPLRSAPSMCEHNHTSAFLSQWNEWNVLLYRRFFHIQCFIQYIINVSVQFRVTRLHREKKLIVDWGREGVSGTCIVITVSEPQPWEQSLKSADEAVLAAPILSALSAGTRHCCLVAHILPPSLCFSVSSALLLFYKCEERICGCGWCDVAADQPLSMKSWSVLSVKRLVKYVV